jgi:CubicO group peptidase (beta-lactamase class C family)
MRDSGIPGASYAVVERGSIIALEARGSSHGGQAVTPSTPFQLGSISKSFTALAVMQLQEAGKLDLTAPLSRYLLEFDGSKPGEITLHQLLTHTSGFSEAQGNRSQTDLAVDRDALTRRITNLASTPPAYAPGVRWEYSNANYEILGLVVERVSGQSYREYVEQHVLAPLGMKDSYVIDGSSHPNSAVGHRPWFGYKVANDRLLIGVGSAPQGGIVASARDMARYIGALINQRDDIVSAKTKAFMMSSQGSISPTYGLGWSIDAASGLVSHSGANPGFEALVIMDRKAERGAVVLTNAGSGFGFGQTDALRYGTAARALGVKLPIENPAWKKLIFLMLCVSPTVFAFAIYRNWRRAVAQNRSIQLKSVGWRTLIPVISAVAFAYLALKFIPNQAGAGIFSILLFIPDLGQLLLLNSGISVLWGVSCLVGSADGVATTSLIKNT